MLRRTLKSDACVIKEYPINRRSSHHRPFRATVGQLRHALGTDIPKTPWLTTSMVGIIPDMKPLGTYKPIGLVVWLRAYGTLRLCANAEPSRIETLLYLSRAHNSHGPPLTTQHKDLKRLAGSTSRWKQIGPTVRYIGP